MSSLVKDIANRLRAGALVIVVQEADETLAVEAARVAASSMKSEFDRPSTVVVMSGSDPDAATKLGDHPKGTGTLILSDYLLIYGDNPLPVRMVREVALQGSSRPEGSKFSRLILVEQPGTKIPSGLVGDAEIITVSLPSVEDLGSELDGFVEAQGIDLPGNGETRYTLASAMAGLPRHEASRLLARGFVDLGRESWSDVPRVASWLRAEKARRVAARLGGALTFEPTEGPDVGGLENLRSWLKDRKAAFSSQKAREYGLPEPKGVIILGSPGCGKSATARAVARDWGLPLLRLDAGRLFGSLVGQSESQTRQAIEAAEACAPAVLFIDELEKALSGGGSGSSTDGGTTQRVFGALLTWLQDKKSPVFVVATVNRIAALPPELLRKGRFDEIFFVGLPSVDERREIARIHLARRGRPESMAPAIAEATSGFSGAEIEQAIVDGMFTSFGEDRDLELKDVVAAAKATSPLSRTMAEEVKAMESWAVGRARPASRPPEAGLISGAEMAARADTQGPIRRGPSIG